MIPVEELTARAFVIPTDAPESDGTHEWDSTTLVLVEARAGGCAGIGYSYTHACAVPLIMDLRERVLGQDVMDTEAIWRQMAAAVRNLGLGGIAATAISAIDCCLWDLKAKVLGQSLVKLLGQVREEWPVYGSGGFTSYSIERLVEQMGGWADDGHFACKMKVGRNKPDDLQRVRAAREAMRPECRLFVDGNNAYGRKEALYRIEQFAEVGDIRWMEQPIDHRDLVGLRQIRERAPARVAIADGEYAYGVSDFRLFIENQCVDVLMPDVTRCMGVTGMIKVNALCEAHGIPMSSHCAPAQTAPLGCALSALKEGEYFHDHARIENRLFDGSLRLSNGALRPDPTAPGFGLTFKEADAKPYAI